MRTRAPRMRPSLATANSTSSWSSRAWPAASRFSVRSSIHFTGRPSRRAAVARADLLAGRVRLLAERPADVAAAHPHLLLGDPEQRAPSRPGAHAGSGGPRRSRAHRSRRRSSRGTPGPRAGRWPCAAARTTRAPPGRRARTRRRRRRTPPRGGTSRWCRPRRTAACPCGSNASSAVTTGGSGSTSTWTSSHASSAAARLSATTIAIGSPTMRTLSLASTGYGGAARSGGAYGRSGPIPSRSSAVRTRATPGCSRAASTSTVWSTPCAT